MDFGAAVIFAADAIERSATSPWTYAVLGGLAVLVAASFVLGEQGARLRAGLVRLAAFAFIGGAGTLGVLSVKGAPDPAKTVAEATKASAEDRLDAWLDRLKRRAETAPTRRSPPAQAEKIEPKDIAEEARRLRDVAALRRGHQRVQAEIAAIAEPARTPDQRRREAAAVRGLAEIDRDEGRIESALERFRVAQAILARIGDPAARRAQADASLGVADALDARNDENGARAAYRSAIAAHRGADGVSEPERRTDVAGALLRYAGFETRRRHEEPARAALDEADQHYAALHAQRGTIAVLRARAALALEIGDAAAARRAASALRVIAAAPPLAHAAADADMIEARVELNEGRPEASEALYLRAAAYYRGVPGLDARRATAAALLGHAEAAFAAKRFGLGRESADVAIAIRRGLGDRALAVNALARLAMWEAGAGHKPEALKALEAAFAAQREAGESRFPADTNAIVQTLCTGILPESGPCKARVAPNSSASGP